MALLEPATGDGFPVGHLVTAEAGEVIGYWLLVIGYWLLVIGYWLLVIGYWLEVGG
jgi:hypothetical protein